MQYRNKPVRRRIIRKIDTPRPPNWQTHLLWAVSVAAGVASIAEHVHNLLGR